MSQKILKEEIGTKYLYEGVLDRTKDFLNSLSEGDIIDLADVRITERCMGVICNIAASIGIVLVDTYNKERDYVLRNMREEYNKSIAKITSAENRRIYVRDFLLDNIRAPEDYMGILKQAIEQEAVFKYPKLPESVKDEETRKLYKRAQLLLLYAAYRNPKVHLDITDQEQEVLSYFNSLIRESLSVNEYKYLADEWYCYYKKTIFPVLLDLQGNFTIPYYGTYNIEDKFSEFNMVPVDVCKNTVSSKDEYWECVTKYFSSEVGKVFILPEKVRLETFLTKGV